MRIWTQMATGQHTSKFTSQEQLVLEYLTRFVMALRRDSSALTGMRTLIASGCDPLLVWTLLLAFYDGSFRDGYVNDRTAARAFNRVMKSVARKLRQVEAELDHVPLEYKEPASHFLNEIVSQRTFIETRLLPITKNVADSRGYLRRELHLARAIQYVEATSGKSHYAEFSDLLNCLARAARGKELFDPERIRKIYRRYRKNTLDDVPQLLNCDNTIDSLKSSPVSPFLREWLLESVTPGTESDHPSIRNVPIARTLN